MLGIQGGVGQLLFNGHRVSVGDGKNFCRCMVVMAFTQCHQSLCLKMVKRVDFICFTSVKGKKQTNLSGRGRTYYNHESMWNGIYMYLGVVGIDEDIFVK